MTNEMKQRLMQWSVNGSETTTEIWVQDFYGNRICTVNQGESGADIGHLIASAPDLLAALELIDSNAAESVEWIRRVARAAIRKSTGEI